MLFREQTVRRRGAAAAEESESSHTGYPGSLPSAS